ncbi:V-type ATP synthase subunit E [Aerococcus urinae]|uniref:V-type ATP synthase subunit E family protein n=1 Tax=Aerococcus urinae TaxID=1376 RepID=A0A0X8FDS9_9LACT|nr:V-type ATP synthase subunit E family protein [Aerococcus urinae]AMB95493.1 hypothetical protein AWM73_02660 [Aerococcus urinae]MCY3032649.1 V-type ATP synthase subunit E family protein [Aerococcus urinae]MCY3037950.1 V-type ATP synthase subunit E family protein [Aerococcus urinae]MCY3044695.1 V-type ATP synthase subunit E family protein [Aerococcus urinae]MCY3045831.1 V-type ATP synthase subunit E family protein [Aerococcus urinae]
MATIKQLTEEVYKEVRSENEAKLDHAKATFEKDISDAKEQSQAKWQKQKEKAERDYHDNLERQKQSYSNQLNQDLLAKKQELIQQAFKEAQLALSQLSQADFVSMLDQALSAIPQAENTQIVVGELSQKQLDQEAKVSLQEKYPHIGFSQDSLKGHGGVVIEQETMNYDLTFDQLIREQEDHLSVYVAKQLND